MRGLLFLLPFSIPVAMGYVPLGAVFGFLMVQAGAVWWLPLLTSVLVFAGAAQFMAIPLLTAGSPLSAIALATLVVNLRHMFYGFSLLEKMPVKYWQRIYFMWALTDENYSVFSTLPPDTSDTQRVGLAMLNHGWWVLGTLLGVVLGAQVSHSLVGLEFSLAALFAVLAVEQWRATRQPLPMLTAIVAYALASWCWPQQALTVAIGMSLLMGIVLGSPQPKEQAA